MMSIPERKDVNFADTWALTDLYGSDAEWQEDFQWNQDYLNYVKGYQGRLGESAQLLYNWLQLGDEMSRIFERLAVYAFRRADELAMAMESRCYHGGEGRTRMAVLRFARRDGVALGATLALVALILWVQAF